MSTTVRYIVLFFCADLLFAQQKPPMPVQIRSVHSISLPANVPSALVAASPGPLAAYAADLVNTATQDIVVLSIDWVMEGPDGKVLPGRRFSYWYRAGGRPVLAAGEVKTVTQIAVQKGTPKPVVDVVMLADGSAWGKNLSGTLQHFADNLSIKWSAEKWILSLLESDGLEKTKETLRKDLAKEAEDRKYFNPRWMDK